MKNHLGIISIFIYALYLQLISGCILSSSDENKNENNRKTGETELFELGNSGVFIKMIWIEPGDFIMGGPEDSLCEDRELPVHSVTITNGFWLSKCEITQQQWFEVMGTEKSHHISNGPDKPAIGVSWFDAQDFISAINPDSNLWRLPSEAEWEYACRAGSESRYPWGDELQNDSLALYAHYWPNPYYEPVNDVGNLRPNDWGFCDMLGNAVEWIEDDAHTNYINAPLISNAWVEEPRSATRICRGAWNDTGQLCSNSARQWDFPDCTGILHGFRLVRDAIE